MDDSGAIVEPPDYLVAREDEGAIEALLGEPATNTESGPMVELRVATRVPLNVLAPRRGRLSSLLGLAEGARRNSPVAREAALEGIEAWRKRWRSS